MKKYVVISVTEREISKVGVTNTLDEATELMRSDFLEVLKSEEDFIEDCNELYETVKNGNYVEDYDYHFKHCEASLTASRNYDWEIFVIDTDKNDMEGKRND